MAGAEHWSNLVSENWRYPVGDLPDTPEKAKAYTPYKTLAWIGANQAGMYTRFVNDKDDSGLTMALECGGMPIEGVDSGARAVLTARNTQWLFLAHSEGEVIRYRTFARYGAELPMQEGEGLFTQVCAEIKSNYRPNAEVQVLLETREDGKAYHILKGLGPEGYVKGTIPLDWKADNEYQLRVFLSRFSDGWAEFIYKGEVLRVTGPNMAPGGECALIPLLYTSAVKTGTPISVRYLNAIIDHLD